VKPKKDDEKPEPEKVGVGAKRGGEDRAPAPDDSPPEPGGEPAAADDA
jgi:hypothetical protein